MPIRILDSKVVSRIAAGEVVERPASAVKELVENALDAAASEITVEIEENGLSLIRVTDNGTGIPASEVALAFGRHATSKISSLEDLENISSLGFRGEALPSIASVSDMEMVTRSSEDSAGYFITLRDGTIVGEGSRARSVGTTVTVKNLFRRVPARLKFLKSPATENARIASVVSQYSLCFPEVKFTLINGGRTILRTNGNGKLLDAVSQVYGLEIARNMLDIGESSQVIDAGSTPIVVTGIIGSPAINRATADYISFFVNRRWIVSRLLIRALEEAYHGLLMTGKHPIAVINISLSPKEIDVNIHPAKTEIKFRNDGAIFTAVQRAVRQVLVSGAPVHRIAEPSILYVVQRTLSPVSRKTGTETDLWSPVKPETKGGELIPETPRNMLPVLRLLGQVSGCYIAAEGPDGLYLIDQHAAHERILFEKISGEHLRHGVEVQGLLEPATFEVSPGQDSILKSHLDELTEFGFSLEPFGNRTYMARAIPSVLSGEDWRGALTEILDALTSESRVEYSEKIAITLACHSAVRAGKKLSDKEMQELIRELEKTSLPNTCPHGRPTILKLSSSELEKHFGRS